MVAALVARTGDFKQKDNPMANPTFPYEGVLVRDSFADNGSQPSMDCVYRSPDIIPYGDDLLTLETAISSYGSDIGKGLSTGSQSVNNVYVRAKNLNAAAQTAKVKLYYASASLLNAPTIGGTWQSVLSGTGLAEIDFKVPASPTPTTSIPSNGIAATAQAFAMNGISSPAQGDHFCLMAIVDEPGFEITVPSSWTSNSAFANWVASNPAVGWRNITHYTNTSNAFSGNYQFGNLNSSPETFEFILSCDGPYLPVGTTVTVFCTDAGFPFSLSQTVSSVPASGTQYLTFIPEQDMPAGFAGALTVEIIPGTETPVPSGLSLHFNYYQVPDTSIDLDVKMTKTLSFVDHAGAEHATALVALGAITIVTQ